MVDFKLQNGSDPSALRVVKPGQLRANGYIRRGYYKVSTNAAAKNRQLLKACIIRTITDIQEIAVLTDDTFSPNLLDAATRFNAILHANGANGSLFSKLGITALEHTIRSMLLNNELPIHIKDTKITSVTENEPPLYEKSLPMPHEKPSRTGIRYYSTKANSVLNHKSEAFRIFLSTQFERFIAAIGDILRVFGLHLFQGRKYFRREEKEKDIYAGDRPIAYAGNDALSPSSYWVGHASNLFRVPVRVGDSSAAITVLTDPVDGDLNSLFYPRKTRPGRKITDCPRVDVCFISHNHLDHCDDKTLKKLLPQQPTLLVPKGTESHFSKLGFSKVYPLNWWDQAEVTVGVVNGNDTGTVRITAVPAFHWSARK